MKDDTTFYDYGRILFSVIVPVFVFWQTGLSKFHLFLSAVIFIYSIVNVAVQRQYSAVKKYQKFFIFIDTALISLMLFLINDNSAYVLLSLIQLLGVYISFGLPEILTAFYAQTVFYIVLDLRMLRQHEIAYQISGFIPVVYFLAAVILLTKAWSKERLANREMVNKLTRKIQNIRDTYEISKFLSFSDANVDVKQLISRLTLKDLEADAGAVFVDDGDGLEPRVFLQVPDKFEHQMRDQAFIQFLNGLILRGDPLVIDDTGKTDHNLLRLLPFLKTSKNFRSVLIYPSTREVVSQVVIIFSGQQGFFTGGKVASYRKTFEKSLYTLDRLQENALPGDIHPEDEQEKLFNTVSALLARLFRSEMCLIALFDGGEKLILKGTFSDSYFKVGTVLDHREEIIYFTISRNQATVVDDSLSRGVIKFNGISYKNLLCVPVNFGTKILGIITIINKHAENFENFKSFNQEDQLLLKSLANQIGLAVENRLLFKVQKETFVTTIRSLVQALDARDPYTKGHSEQVALYAVMIAKEMGLSEIEIENIHFAALLHDIGKIGIPETLLNKPDKFTCNEYNQIKMHPYISAQILKPVSLFTSLIPFVYHHHERWDGKGYPDGLKGEDIPLGARILAVADSFDAMVADRIYRRGKSKDTAVNELVRCAAGQFDPRVVDAFLTGLEKQLFEEKVESVWKFDNLSNVFRDVLDAVTSGQLVISDDGDISELKQEGRKLGEASIRIPEDIGKARLIVKEVLQKYLVPEKEINKILLCISEVTTNMIKHASGGTLTWYLCEDCKIRIIAEDTGPGIKLADLPKATLVQGAKKKKALGLGFTLLLELLNKVYMKTGEQGTTLILDEQLDCDLTAIMKADKVS